MAERLHSTRNGVPTTTPLFLTLMAVWVFQIWNTRQKAMPLFLQPQKLATPLWAGSQQQMLEIGVLMKFTTQVILLRVNMAMSHSRLNGME